MLNNTSLYRYKNENKTNKNKKLNKHQHKQKKYLFYTLYYNTMKHFTIIYGKKRNYKGIEFMEYNLIERTSNENLMINGFDFMRIGETKKRTIEVYNNRLETQKNKLEDAGYKYWDIVYELNYCIENKHLHINH